MRRRALVGLMRMDLQRHREGFLIGLPAILLVTLYTGLFEIASGPLFLLLGSVMAVSCGAGLGRSECVLGLEEYSLGLPPTRADRYGVRFALGAAFLLAILSCGLAAGPLGWVRGALRLLPLELPASRASELAWPGFEGPGFYLLCIGVSCALYCDNFAARICARSRQSTMWALGTLPLLLGCLLLALVDWSLFAAGGGYLTGLLALAYCVPRTRLGLRAYERKDIAPEETPDEGGARVQRRSVVLVVALGLGVLATVGVWLYFSFR